MGGILRRRGWTWALAARLRQQGLVAGSTGWPHTILNPTNGLMRPPGAARATAPRLATAHWTIGAAAAHSTAPNDRYGVQEPHAQDHDVFQPHEDHPHPG